MLMQSAKRDHIQNRTASLADPCESSSLPAGSCPGWYHRLVNHRLLPPTPPPPPWRCLPLRAGRSAAVAASGVAVGAVAGAAVDDSSVSAAAAAYLDAAECFCRHVLLPSVVDCLRWFNGRGRCQLSVAVDVVAAAVGGAFSTSVSGVRLLIILLRLMQLMPWLA